MAPIKRPPHQRQKTFLREWRAANEMTQDHAARQIGIAGSSLGRLEIGASAYSQNVIEKLADLYGCTPAELIGVDPTQDKDLVELTRIFQNAEDKEKKQILSIARTIVGSLS